MKTNDFFNRVSYIFPEENRTKIKLNCLSQGISIDTYAPIIQSPVMPHVAPFSAAELIELLSFYSVIRSASVDRIERLLILSGNLKFSKGFQKNIERVFEEMPQKWDLLFLGYQDATLKSPKKEEDKIIHAASSVDGCFAVGVNHSFFHLFLEDAKVPQYNLNQHIKVLSLVSDLFIVSPPLITKA